ncbi:MAG TPA: NYN domain-containing protein [Solirubrobacteraceae bacterium]|nr:NYN domain-containing protein [Solirubrobacteraceae bacterium]
MTRWLVDGMNAIGSRPTGWWRDRPGAMRAFVARLDAFAAATGDEVAVVFDGRPFDLAGDRVHVAFATRRGRDAADDDIAGRAAPGVSVVTSDAELTRRARAAGAETVSAGAVLRELENRTDYRTKDRNSSRPRPDGSRLLNTVCAISVRDAKGKGREWIRAARRCESRRSGCGASRWRVSPPRCSCWVHSAHGPAQAVPIATPVRGRPASMPWRPRSQCG